MKTKFMLSAILSLFLFTGLFANTTNDVSGTNDGNIRYNNRSIEFVEQGIKFYVYLNGDFDFEANLRRHAGVQIDRRGIYISTSPHRVSIDRDRHGRITRVGNVKISYTKFDRIKHIGRVKVDYHGNRVTSVGNLDVIYTRHGIYYEGQVNGRGYYDPYHYTTWEYGYYDPFFETKHFRSDFERFDEDDDFYYFKSNKKNKNGKGEVIKRKKAEKSKKNESRRQL